MALDLMFTDLKLKAIHRSPFYFRSSMSPDFSHILTLLVPRVVVPTPSERGGGGVENDKPYEHEALGGVRGIFQGLRKVQIDITAFVWLPWQSPSAFLLFVD